MTDKISAMGKRLGLSPDQIRAALRGYEANPRKAAARARFARRSGSVQRYLKCLKKNPVTGGEQALAGALLMAVEAQAEYRRRGIDPAVFDATMSDIKIWADRYRQSAGCEGLGEINWIIQHCRLRLFRLGRLQFYRSRVRLGPFVPAAARRALPVRTGQRCLDIHIPEGERLAPEECQASMERARPFFQAYFPQDHAVCYTCFSWLLYSQNRCFLPENSNIAAFMDQWDVLFDWADDRQAIERIWGSPRRDPADYPADTSLRRSARDWLMAGHSLGMGLGLRYFRSESSQTAAVHKKRTP